MSDIGQFGMWLAFAGTIIGFCFSPIGHAIARRVAPGKQDDHTRELETRVSELEANCERMSEIEERLEFTERVLAQYREAERLPEAR